MASYYSWTELKYADKKGELQTIPKGEKVTATKLNTDADEFQSLVECGAIRTRPFPDIPANWPGSPIEYLLKKNREELEELEGQIGEEFYRDADGNELTEEDLNEAPVEVDEDSNVVDEDDD